jgi:hypothetical protein
MALDITGGGDSNVHSGKIVVRIFRIAGVILDFFPN